MNWHATSNHDAPPPKRPSLALALCAWLCAGMAAIGCSDDSLVVGSLTTPDALLDGQHGDIVGSTGDAAPEPGDTNPNDGAAADTGADDTGSSDADPADTGAQDTAPDDAEPDGAPLDTTPDDGQVQPDAVDDAGPVTPTCPDCPTGYVCRLEGGPPRCVADPALSCAPCALDLSCAGGLCLSLAGEAKGCLLPCPDPGGGCALGQSCQLMQGVELCVPDTGSCTCSAETAGATQPCATGGVSVGACTGVRVCAPDKGGWSVCSAVGATLYAAPLAQSTTTRSPSSVRSLGKVFFKNTI